MLPSESCFPKASKGNQKHQGQSSSALVEYRRVGCSPVKPSAGTSIMANQGGLSPTQEAPRAPCDFRIETRSHQAHQTPKSWHPLFSGLGLVWAFPLCWLSPRLSSGAARSLPQGSCPPPSRLYHNPPTLFFVPKTSVCKCTLDSSPLFSPASGSF